MIFKYTKCESVIAKIMSDLGKSEKDIRITDMREWIFEAVEKIGAPVQYIQKETEPLTIADFQVPIPEDLHNLNTVAYSLDPCGHYVPVRSTDSSMKSVNGQYYGRKTMYNVDHSDVTYFVKPGWLVINKGTGFIKISYKAIATDERGYPLIPDTASYQEAVYWYVVMKLKFNKFLNGSLGGRAKYNQGIYTYLQSQWNFYRNQAYAEAMMPDDGTMRSIKNEWTKLIPDWESDDSFFINNGIRQLNYNDYYYGH